MTKEELLAEVEDLLRNMPDRATISHNLDENFSWLGRVAAVLTAWDPVKAVAIRLATDMVHGLLGGRQRQKAVNKILTMLNEARYDLRMRTVGPINVVVAQGYVFDYFDEIRKVIELAKQDVLFVDPYLDAEFVAKYLGHVADGANIRLLARKKLETLLPAVDSYSEQHQRTIEVRSTPGIHDRFVFIDQSSCYQSGASFKDGAKNAPVTLTQIVDAFAAIQQTYETKWDGAKVER